MDDNVDEDRKRLTIDFGASGGPDAFARQFAELLGEIITQKLRELPPRQPKLLLTVDEAASRLAVNRSVIYEFLRSGQLESVKIGCNRRVLAAAVDEFVAQLREEQRERST